MKPKILIYGNVYDSTVGIGIPYIKFFSQFGDVIIVTSEMNLERFVEEGDILALPGGMDIFSFWYSSPPGLDSRHGNQHFDYLDQMLLKPWLKTGKPIVGICRGMQVLNVMMGGSLHPHVNHHIQDDKKLNRWDRPDEMFTTEFGPECNIYPINSFHHQAVKKVADGFRVIGWSHTYQGCPSLRRQDPSFEAVAYRTNKEGKTVIMDAGRPQPMVVEMMVHKTLPYIAFQYHPEEFMCNLATTLIEDVLKKYEDSKNTGKKADQISKALA